MKIAFISTMAASPWAGSEELWVAAAREALQARHRVIASTFRWRGTDIPSKLKALEAEGADMVWRPRYRLPSADELAVKVMNLLSGRVFARHVELPPVIGSLGSGAAFSKIARQQPDIVCLSQGWPYDMLDAPGSRTLLRQLVKSGFPYVIVCHLNIDFVQPRDVVREEVAKLYTQAARALFVSKNNLETTERQLAVNLPGAEVVANPVNLGERGMPPPVAADGVVRFATVARLDASQKGYDILFETLSRPPWRERADWRLDLYGSGEDERYLRRLAQHFGIDSRVHFAGHVADVRSIWREHPLLLLPSRAEGTPLALIEAMLCGRAAVATDVGGNAEWIEDGVTGYLAEAPTTALFGNALERAWVQRERWAEMGLRAHAAAAGKIHPAPARHLLRFLQEAALR